jgi:hypothetical protein
MLHIKKFLDKVSHLESKKAKDLVIPLSDARLLRDEIAKLLADLYQSNTDKKSEVIQVEIKGGNFK